jgi:protein-disulfide isomerase
MAEQPTQKGGLSQGKTFVLGLIVGFLVLCTIGFFVLLNKVMDDDSAGFLVNTDSDSEQVTPPAEKAAPTAITVKKVEEDENILGNKNAKITLVEYSDFECPFCSRFMPTVDAVLENYPDDVRVVFRHFPLRSIHAEAAPAANASECAAEQGRFWEFHDGLFENQTTLGSATYTKLATELGLNLSKFEECVSSNKYAAAVQEDEVSAQQAGGQGTPYSILIGPDGQTIPVSGAQPFSVVEAAIQQML